MSHDDASYWMATTADAPSFPRYDGEPLSADVVVVGGGVAGLTTAALLSERGVAVAVVEARQIGGGVTGYSTAKVTALHGLVYAKLRSSLGAEKARLYGEANLAGIAEIERLAHDHGIACELARLPAFTYTTDPARVGDVEQEVEAAGAAGLRVTFTQETGLPYAVAGAIRAEDQAQFHPRRFCLGLARALVDRGASVYEGTRVLKVERGDPHVVVTDRGPITANQVVLATQLPIHDPAGFFARAAPYRSYAMAATLRDPVPGGMYLGVDSPTRSIRPVVPGSSTGIFGGESHKVGQGGDTRQYYESLESWLRSTFAVEQVEHRWSAQDYMPADDVPYLGRLAPGAERAYVLTGFKKWGFTHAAVGARIVADLVTGGENPWLDVFDATRLRPTPSALKMFVKENADVAKRFVGDRVATARPPSAESLAAGEAGIVDADGEKVAAFRDDGGALHAVSARCTHLGCLVSWNSAERTWDCPCHGSRFTVDGEVVQGPAVRNLEPHGPPPA